MVASFTATGKWVFGGIDGRACQYRRRRRCRQMMSTDLLHERAHGKQVSGAAACDLRLHDVPKATRPLVARKLERTLGVSSCTPSVYWAVAGPMRALGPTSDELHLTSMCLCRWVTLT